MKKIIIASLLLLCGTAVFAQYSFGIKAGFDTSLGFDENWNFDTDNLKVNNKTSYGFNIGLMSRFGHRAFAQIEAVYHFETSLKNISTSLGFESGDSEKVNKHAVRIPAMFGFKIVDRENFDWYILVGPTFNFNIGKGTKYDGDVSTERKTVTFGLDCGTGFDIYCMTIDLRYKLLQADEYYKFCDKTVNLKPTSAFEVALAWRFLDKL